MKARLAGAHKGHNLLKRKADALQLRFRMILGKIIEVLKKETRLGFANWKITWPIEVFFLLFALMWQMIRFKKP